MRSQRLEKPCERFCSFDKGLYRLKGKTASCASPGATRPQANLQITRTDEVDCRFAETTVSHLPVPLQTLQKPPAVGQCERKQKSRRIRRLYAGFCGFYRIAGGGPSETSVEPAGVPVQRGDRAADTDGFYCGAVSVCKADAEAEWLAYCNK